MALATNNYHLIVLRNFMGNVFALPFPVCFLYLKYRHISASSFSPVPGKEK